MQPNKKPARRPAFCCCFACLLLGGVCGVFGGIGNALRGVSSTFDSVGSALCSVGRCGISFRHFRRCGRSRSRGGRRSGRRGGSRSRFIAAGGQANREQGGNEEGAVHDDVYPSKINGGVPNGLATHPQNPQCEQCGGSMPARILSVFGKERERGGDPSHNPVTWAARGGPEASSISPKRSINCCAPAASFRPSAARMWSKWKRCT